MQALLWVSKQNIKKKLEFPHFLPHASWKAWSEREITSQGFIGQIWEEKLRCLQRDDDDVLDHDAPRWHTWQRSSAEIHIGQIDHYGVRI